MKQRWTHVSQTCRRVSRWPSAATGSRGETHAVGGLDRSDQVESLPDVNVSVKRPGVRDVIFSRSHTQDGLQVARLPENPPLWRESVTAQGPELRTQTEAVRKETGRHLLTVRGQICVLDAD